MASDVGGLRQYMQPLDLVSHPEPKTILDYWRQHRIDTVVYPFAWVQGSQKHQLTWQSVRFTEANRNSISPSRGIYAFVVRIDAASLPHHSYVVYIGITGDKRDRTLRDRYGDYLRDRRLGSKRPRLKEMFELWGDHLDFWYCPLPDRSVDLSELEKDLCTAILPPLVEDDFHQEFKASIKLLRTN